MTQSKIIWTKTDEAPLLATYSLLPIIRAYTEGTGIDIELSDISLAGRVIANFPDNLNEDQKIPDHLSSLGELAKTPDGKPRFNKGMLGTVTHEFCHSYTNPIVDRHEAELAPAGKKIFPHVEEAMRRQ